MKFDIILIVSIASSAFCMNHLQKSLNFPDLMPSLKALNDVVDVFYSPGLPIDIFYKKTNFSRTIHNEFMAQNNGKFTYRIRNLEKPIISFKISSISFEYSCVLEANMKFNVTSKNSDIKFVIYVGNCLAPSGFSIWKLTFEWAHVEDFEYILYDEDDIIKLISVEFFTETTCNKRTLVVLNTFNKTTQKWSKKLENHKKFRNFHGCELMMLATTKVDGDPFIGLDVSKNKFKSVGLIPNLFEDIGKYLNYKPKYSYKIVKESTETFHCIMNKQRRKTESNFTTAQVCFVAHRIYALEKIFNTILQYSDPFMIMHDIIFITPGDPYTSYEKLILPFDSITWSLLLTTFLIAFFVVFIINFFPKSFQNILYGNNVNFPAHNIISTFFGISQTIIPNLNFPRFILMSFVLFCLIFRTCYQSKLFEFMTSTPRRPPLNSLEEMAEKNYKLYTIDQKTVYDNAKDNNDNWPEIYRVDVKNLFHKILTQSQNSSAKFGFIFQQYSKNTFEKIIDYSLDWYQLPEYFMTIQIGFLFYNNNFYLNIINNFIRAWTPTGIMRKHLNDIFDEKIKFVTENSPKVFKFEDLEFEFLIWIGCCGISIFSLIAEYSINFLKKILKKPKLRRIKFAKVHPLPDADEGALLSNSPIHINLESLQEVDAMEGVESCDKC